MKGVATSIRVLSLAFALVLLGTSCTKEEVVAPEAPAVIGQGVAKGAGNNPNAGTANGNQAPTSTSPTSDPRTNPSNISDDGDNQGDRERGRPKRFR